MRCATTLVAVALFVSSCVSAAPDAILDQTARFGDPVDLPAPIVAGPTSLEATLAARRSARGYADSELSTELVGQLLWAAQGVTSPSGGRTAPSAGALYPLELYVITSENFAHYLPSGHRIEKRSDSRPHSALRSAAFGQEFVFEAPVVLVITGTKDRTATKYGAVASDLMNREAGHAAQNVLLQSHSLGLAAVPVGGFDPERLRLHLALPPGEEVLYLIPVGRPDPVGD